VVAALSGKAAITEANVLQPGLEQLLVECRHLISRRRFFTSTSTIGLASEQCMPGDSIVILAGCPVPVLLRKEADHWTYKGEAFAHGYMYGEINRHVESDKTFWTDFHIH